MHALLSEPPLFLLSPTGQFGNYGATVNTPLLVADPPAVVMVISPVFAPAGTVAVTSVSLFTWKLADSDPNWTLVV